ncbi:MAG: hypothetical protein ABJD07_03685 [Gemmatimonadaceae bacterium]
MSLEMLPVLFGALIALVGLTLLLDASIPDRASRVAERRKRERPERHRLGEAALGLGILGTGAALIGRDTWRYTNIALILALVMFVVGMALNYKYLRGRYFGPTHIHTGTRRAADREPEPPEPPIRLR